MTIETTDAEPQDNTEGEAPEEQTTTPAPDPVPAADQAPAEEAASPPEKPADAGEDLGLLKVAPEKAAEAPETYEEFTMPEGVASLTEEDLKAFQAAAKDSSLTQEEANKAAAATSRFMSSLIEEQKQERAKEIEAYKEEWNKHPDSEARAIKALEVLDQSGLKEHFKQNGYMHDAKLMGVLADYGNMSGEAKSVRAGDSPTSQPGSWYPNSPGLKK